MYISTNRSIFADSIEKQVLMKITGIGKAVLLVFFLCIGAANGFGQKYSFSGRVINEKSKAPVEFANVYITDTKQQTLCDLNGKFNFKQLPAGKLKIRIYNLGYKTKELQIHLDKNLQDFVIELQEKDTHLKEVVITATESKGIVTSSKIDRPAMQHLQPSSFTDLLELLPGGVTKDPDMGSANTITMRETGVIKADGTKGNVSDDYAITSLGTQFVIDDIPMNTDANLQSTPMNGASFEGSRNIVNKGVDMRSISTDDIESVEIIRGIPSAEYGNLTSGVINIKKIRKETPLNARFKADGYSKLFSAGKGIALTPGNHHILNVDLGYFDAKPDPRNNLINYKRLNTSLRYTYNQRINDVAMRYTSGVDYTGSFDNAKEDPELNHGNIDTYKSTYNRVALTNNFLLKFPELKLLKSVELNTSVNSQFDRLERTKLVAPQRYMIVPNTSEAGEHDATLLFKEYVADYLCDGKPFNAFVKAKANLGYKTATTQHDIKLGGEWNYTKNFGRGQVYDLSRPLAGSWSSRPRAYKDIPDLQNVSFFAEEVFTAHWGGHTLKAMGGLRGLSLVHLDKKYEIGGKVYLDPRANLLWNLPTFHIGKQPISVAFGGGIGKTTKMPTLDYLFPDLFYHDIIQLGYYDVNQPEKNSRFNVMSYISDRTNYALKPARNLKWELRTDFSVGANRLSINYFKEKMSSGFRYMSHYAPYAYKQYDASAINSSSLQAPPDLATLPYVDMTVLDGYNQAANGSKLLKEGVEFQFHSQRIQPLYTTINLNGAWFRSTYTNSQRMMRTVSEVVNGQSISDKYVGIYNWNDGNVYNQFNTNILLDTQVPQWGLIFSTSLQFMWFTSKQTLYRDGTPEAYLSAEDGLEHPYTATAAEDAYLQHLIIPMSDQMFDKYTVPMSFFVNLKVTKTIGKNLKLAFFANKLIDHTPDFTSNGQIVRRNVKPYFGMELNFTL